GRISFPTAALNHTLFTLVHEHGQRVAVFKQLTGREAREQRRTAINVNEYAKRVRMEVPPPRYLDRIYTPGSMHLPDGEPTYLAAVYFDAADDVLEAAKAMAEAGAGGATLEFMPTSRKRTTGSTATSPGWSASDLPPMVPSSTVVHVTVCDVTTLQCGYHEMRIDQLAVFIRGVSPVEVVVPVWLPNAYCHTGVGGSIQRFDGLFAGVPCLTERPVADFLPDWHPKDAGGKTHLDMEAAASAAAAADAAASAEWELDAPLPQPPPPATVPRPDLEPPALRTRHAIAAYLDFNFIGQSPLLALSQPIPGQQMHIDTRTSRHLELTLGPAKWSKRGTTLHALDHSVTPAGYRALQRALLSPVLHVEEINERHGRVDTLQTDLALRGRVKGFLDSIRGLRALED
ncbi:hypothetical protein BC828DRAFT_410098, partial [Blastocladiella britannica]